MIRSSASISTGPLTPTQAAAVAGLADAARRADGVAPLSEHVLLHLWHAGPRAARDLLLSDGDSVAGYAHLDPAPADGPGAGDMSGELVVHPARRRRGHGSALVSALTASPGGFGIRLWAHGDLPAAAELARSGGFTRFRALWQMRMSLTGSRIPDATLPAGVTLRTFRPGQDEESWLTVNRRAFASHPEQGSWTRGDLNLRAAEPWFDPAGFFLAWRGDGELAGFHWTKVHQPDAAGPAIGEVYVVGVDPASQGGGLGRALTLAGLAHLQRRGLAAVMLYVDESNEPAIRMYTNLGFSRRSTDVMYRRAPA